MSEPPRRVCVLGEGEYSDFRVIDVFVSEDLARAYVIDYLYPQSIAKHKAWRKAAGRTPPTAEVFIKDYSFDEHALHEVPQAWWSVLRDVRGVR